MSISYKDYTYLFDEAYLVPKGRKAFRINFPDGKTVVLHARNEKEALAIAMSKFGIIKQKIGDKISGSFKVAKIVTQSKLGLLR